MRFSGPLDPDELNALPAAKGSYGIFLQLPKGMRLAIGRLGSFDFPAGDYVYLGSAHGPGGLRARLNHHARLTPNPHWHLDYLRPFAAIAGGFWKVESERASLPLECAWARQFLQKPGAAVVAPGFGASDCRGGCASHLIYFPSGLPTACDLLK